MNNLLKGSFEFWSPTEGQMPEHFKEAPDIVGLCSSKPYCFGKWVSRVEIESGTYTASVECNSESPYNSGHVYAMVNWLDKDGKYLRREYLTPTGASEWFRVECTASSPTSAAYMEIELTLASPGEVRWKNASIVKAEAVTPRPVKIASAFFTPRRNLAQNLETMLSLCDKAGPVDVLLFTESAYDRGVSPIEAKCIPVPSQSPDDPLGQLGAKARLHNCNILVNVTENDGGFFFNTTVIIGRDGNFIGKYRKSHLPTVEKEVGFSPGNELPVFDLDFARIGILTCFDIVFPQAARTLRSKGAELIFLPTIGNFMLQSQMTAKYNGIHVVVSGGDLPHPSRIIDPNGNIVSSVDGTEDGVAFAEIDLASGFYSPATGFFPASSNAGNALHYQHRHELY